MVRGAKIRGAGDPQIGRDWLEATSFSAESLHEVMLPWLLPGITLNTSPNDHQPIKEFREVRFNGKAWEPLEEGSVKR
jgi:hypothetical protein